MNLGAKLSKTWASLPMPARKTSARPLPPQSRTSRFTPSSTVTNCTLCGDESSAGAATSVMNVERQIAVFLNKISSQEFLDASNAQQVSKALRFSARCFTALRRQPVITTALCASAALGVPRNLLHISGCEQSLEGAV